MCRPYTRQILEGNPYLDEVIVYDKYGKHKSIWSSVKFSLFLRKKKFDWAIILHPTNRAHLVTFFAGIPFRIGWNKKLGFLLTKKLLHKKQEGEKHELEYTLDILRALKLSIVDKTTYFPLKKEAQEKVNFLLGSWGVKEKDKLIVIHPSASCPSKRWPQEYFSCLVRMLKEKLPYKVAVICAKNEEVYGEKVAEESGVIDLRGKLSISELGALLSRSILFISNDSGPVHIASSLGVAVISIFGRKDKGLSPLRWKPLGRKSIYLHKDVGCKVCLAHNCYKGFLCLRAITPQEVMERVTYLLNNLCRIHPAK